jgi:hemoglobin/transferrin/lactoferrin receptor protein
LSSGDPILRNSLSLFGDSASAGFGANLTTSYGTRHFGLLSSLTGHRVNTLAAPAGIDSHSAFYRFFGVPSNVFVGDRLPDTGFTQYGGMFRLNWTPAENSQLLLHYSRNQQDGGMRHDQLLGGDGNLIADLRNFMLDFFYIKFDRQRLGWLDQAGLSYSLNSQREERVNQGGNGNPLASINHEYERTRVNGVQGYADKQLARQDLLLGAEFYHERVTAPSVGVDPVTGAAAVRRGRVPDQVLYKSGGIYLQDVFQLVPQRLRLVGSVRYSAASYRARAADSPLVGGLPLWPDDSLRVSDFTYRGGIVANVAEGLTVSANVSRGFRAPHITDLGTLGLTGSGFEVAAPDVAGLGGTIGTTADASAVSTGRPVVQVEPETSLTYEFGARYQHHGFQTAFAFFVNDINDNITKQALILPQGAVGTEIGGETITAQDPSGVVFVDVSSSPVLVRANFDDARLYGIEHTLNWNITSHWSASTVLTAIHAEDQRTGLAPNIEGGTPAPDLYLKIRYAGSGGRWWIEPYMHAADRQDRLSTLDLGDRRTGASRSRGAISNFFRRGATVRGFVSPGPDTVFGNSDDILRATGETLAEIQDRVLGVGVNEAPLYTAVPGYVTFNLRGGITFGEARRHQLMADFQNIGDRNYRGISWGMDAPGRSLALRYVWSF